MYSELSGAIVSGLTGVADSMQGVIGDVAPVAIGVMGAYLVVRGGIKFFKGVAK